MIKELAYILERFPTHREKITLLYNTDHDFRQLCNDYCLSKNMIEAFKKTEPEIKKVKHDYEVVSGDLEQELAKILEKME